MPDFKFNVDQVMLDEISKRDRKIERLEEKIRKLEDVERYHKEMIASLRELSEAAYNFISYTDPYALN